MTPKLSQMSSANQPSRDARTASVANPVVRPPLVVLASLLSGAVLTVAWPLSFVPHVFRLPVGCSLVAMAAALFSSSIKPFRMAGTPVPGNKPTTAIVRSGPFRFSRNPIYLAFFALHVDPDRCHHRRCRGPARRAVPDRAVRCRIPEIQGLRASLAMTSAADAAPLASASSDRRETADDEEQSEHGGHNRTGRGPRCRLQWLAWLWLPCHWT